MYKNLQGEMVKKGVTRKDLQKLLGLGSHTIWVRFNIEEKGFSIAEAFLIRDTYFPDQIIDELFKQH